ncbi:hypothetical protein Tco_0074577, partial [Tanacetum coccineum]
DLFLEALDSKQMGEDLIMSVGNSLLRDDITELP